MVAGGVGEYGGGGGIVGGGSGGVVGGGCLKIILVEAVVEVGGVDGGSGVRRGGDGGGDVGRVACLSYYLFISKYMYISIG